MPQILFHGLASLNDSLNCDLPHTGCISVWPVIHIRVIVPNTNNTITWICTSLGTEAQYYSVIDIIYFICQCGLYYMVQQLNTIS